MAKVTFAKAEIQRVEFVKHSTSGNPQYRITFNTYNGNKSEPIRMSFSMLTEANAGFAYNLDELRYNQGAPKWATIEASRTETRDRIIGIKEI